MLIAAGVRQSARLLLGYGTGLSALTRESLRTPRRRTLTRERARLPRFEPAGLSALSKVASRSLSGLTRHADGRWALLMFFGKAIYLVFFVSTRVATYSSLSGCM